MRATDYYSESKHLPYYGAHIGANLTEKSAGLV